MGSANNEFKEDEMISRLRHQRGKLGVSGINCRVVDI